MEESQQYTDTGIIEKVLQGEKAMFELIIQRYNAFLYRVGRSYRFNHEDTEDLMQDTYVDAFINLSKFEGRANFKTWIIKIMLNNCYRKRNKSSFKNETMKDKINENSVPIFNGSSQMETDQRINNKDIARVVEYAINAIPNDYSIVFTLRELNELSVSETAKVLGISESNVKVRLNRAKSMMKSAIEKSFSSGEVYAYNLVYCNAMSKRVMNIINKL